MFGCDKMFTSETDDSLPASPTYDRCQSGDEHHAVPPPYTGTFMPLKHDLVFHNAPNISDSEDDSEAELPQNAPSFVQPPEQVKPPRPFIKIVKNSILATNSKTDIPKPKIDRNSINRKACFLCKSLTNLIKDCDNYKKKMAQSHARNHAQRGNHQQYASMTLPNPQRHVVATAVLTKSKLVPITAARPVTAVVLKPHVTRSRPAKTMVTNPHSPPRRHINRSPSPKASNFPPRVTVVKGNPQHALKDKRVIDIRCSRHITGNMSYLSDFEEINGGYVAFGGNPKGGKISGKGKIRTGKLDFDDFYFVKELKFNLFSVSQMRDKKNSVLFTDTECIVLSPEFKMLDGTQVLLRVLRENNMYNVDLKNIVLSGDLTCLFAKAILDESNPWHKRLGHINFKTMNKLVNCNLVRGLPSKVFENNHTCVACKKRKQHMASCNQSNPSAGVQEQYDAEKAGEENVQQYVLFLVWSSGSKNTQNTNGDAAFEDKEPEFEGRKPEYEVHVSPSSSAQTKKHDDKTKREAKGKNPIESSTGYRNLSAEFEDFTDNNINEVNATDSPVPAVGQISTNNTNTFSAVELEDITYSDDEKDVGAKADFTNLETTITVSPIPTTRVHKDHPVTQIIGDLSSSTQTRSMTRVAKDQGGFSQINNDDFHICMSACFLLEEEPKRDTLYEEVFAPVARIEAIRLFFAYASFMGFMVYQMDVKSVFLYETIEEEVYVCQLLRFEDPDYPDKVNKVVKALYGLHQAPRAWKKRDILLVQIYVDDIIFGSTNKDLCKSFEKLMKDMFQMGSMGELTFFLGLQVNQKQDGIFISHNKYVAEILRKFSLKDGKSSSTPIDTEKPLLKDPGGEDVDVDVHTYRSMIVKRIFRYLKGKPHLGLWYPKDSPFNLVAYSDSDYAGANLDRKSTIGGCQFLGCRLISWQYKKQKVVATSSTEAEYVAAASCCAQVLWIQNQLLDYGPDQTVSGKDSSNPLMADNLPKIVWYSTHHVAIMKSWLVQKQMALGMIVAWQDDDVADEGAASVAIDDVPVAIDEPSIPSPTLTTQPPPPSQDLTSTSQDKIAQTIEITKLKQRVKKLERRNKLKVSKLRRLKKVGTAQRVDKSKDTIMDDISKQGKIIANMDVDEDVTLKDVADIAKEVVDDDEIEENADVQGRQAESQAQIYQIDLEHADKVLSMQDDEREPPELQEVVEVVTSAKLMTEVVTTASATITTATTPIPAATLTAAPSVARRRKSVVIRDPEETATPSIIIHSEPKSKDKEKGIMVEDPKPLKKQAKIKQDEAYAKELEAELNKNIN
nr:hypothetical protein [Tanacetum cinerariifolium]